MLIDARPGRWIWRVLTLAMVLGWLYLIYFLSDRTGNEAAADAAGFLFLGPFVDEVAHLVLYGVLATLILWSFWSWRNQGYGEIRWVWLAAGLALLYALTDEYHQTFVPGRSASLKDLLVDGIGGVLAALTWFYLAANWAKVAKKFGKPSPLVTSTTE